MKIKNLWSIGLAVLLWAVFIAGSALWAGDQIMRWDIVSIDFQKLTISEGGLASARAEDNSRITLTSSGTFAAFDPSNVGGGGEWTITDAGGNVTGSGTYSVVSLVSFQGAPGTPPAPLMDLIGDRADARAGLALLRIEYDDGTLGTLTVSCNLTGTPDSVFEGITASKGFVTFWNREAPVDGVDANRTVFHVVRD